MLWLISWPGPMFFTHNNNISNSIVYVSLIQFHQGLAGKTLDVLNKEISALPD